MSLYGILKEIIKIVNYIKSVDTNLHRFKELCKDMASEDEAHLFIHRAKVVSED